MSSENSLVNFLAGPDLTACVDSRTGQSSSPEQRPILTGAEGCCDYTDTMVTFTLSFLTDWSHHYDAIIYYSSNNLVYSVDIGWYN